MDSIVRGRETRGLRVIRDPFVVAPPAGARVRTRLRVTAEDEAVLRAVGRHLGSLASADLAARCAEGRLGARARAVSRRERKRALTAGSSSRWAGAITRVSEDQRGLAERNLRAERSSLNARARAIEARLAVPAGGREGRARGYATQAERHGKQRRLQRLRRRLAEVERQLESGRVSVCRGGRRLARARRNLAAAGLTEDQWRAQWDAARLFLTADGEASAAGEPDDPVASRRAAAGDQAPGAAGAPGQPAARPVPPVVPGRVRLPGGRGRGAGRLRRRPLRHLVRRGQRPLVPGRELARDPRPGIVAG